MDRLFYDTASLEATTEDAEDAEVQS